MGRRGLGVKFNGFIEVENRIVGFPAKIAQRAEGKERFRALRVLCQDGKLLSDGGIDFSIQRRLNDWSRQNGLDMGGDCN